MTQPTRTTILLLLAALFATCAPIARADANDAADGDTETLNSLASMIEEMCPELVDGLLDEDEISEIVTDRAAFKTQACQCLIHASLNDERTFSLMKAGPVLLELETNMRYFMAKLLSSSFRCMGSALDSLLATYSLDDGNASKDTAPPKP
jgi:hypothetical protein